MNKGANKPFYSPMMEGRPRITLKDLSNELQLSQATISRALRGDVAIKESTRKKIRAAARKLGYHSKVNYPTTITLNNIADPAENIPHARLTIYDIARQLNISAATVSRALNDSPKVKKTTKLKIQSIASSSNYDFSENARILIGKRGFKSGSLTIYDIARKLNLSASTVSRCLNGKKCVSQETTDLVRKTAKEIGYATNLTAIRLKQQKTLTIGVLIPNFSKQVYLALQGMENAARYRKVNLLVSNSFGTTPAKPKQINAVLKHADGIIMLPGPYDDLKLLINELYYKKVPMVCLGNYKNSGNIDTITIDLFGTIYELTNHLIMKGNHSICYIDPIADIHGSAGIRAFKQAIADNNLPFEKQFIIEGENYFYSSKLLVEMILSNQSLPDVIVLINSLLDEQAISILQDAGMDIKKRLIICEFDHGLLHDELLEKVQRVSYDFYDLGEKGIKGLIAKIDCDPVNTNLQVFSKHQFYLSK